MDRLNVCQKFSVRDKKFKQILEVHILGKRYNIQLYYFSLFPPTNPPMQRANIPLKTRLKRKIIKFSSLILCITQLTVSVWGCQPVVWEVRPSPDPVEVCWALRWKPGGFEKGDSKEQHIPTALLAMVPTLKATQCFFHSSIGSHYRPPDNENTGCLLR